VEKDKITIGALPSIWGGEGGKAGGQSIFSFRDWEQGPALLIKGCLSIVLLAFLLHLFFLSFFLLTQQVVWFASRNHVDYIYSLRPGLFHRYCTWETSVHTPSGGYLTMYFAALLRSAALPSIAIHTFESLTATVSLYLHPVPLRLVRPHENDQAPLT
jgi:hypothetical protein